MSKEESPPGGLLSKMVRFVRNPTVNWTNLDTTETDRESQYSKQVLKEMLERKRRNDFVRKREFDYLRKLRQRDVLAGHRVEDPVVRPSCFQSSLTLPEDRAGTIKKIDEIEAQMSMQWWKGKAASGEATLAVGATPVPAGTKPGALSPLAPESRPPLAVDSRLLPGALGGGNTSPAPLNASFASTLPVSLPGNLEPQAAAEPLFARDSMPIANFGGVSAQWLSSSPDAPLQFSPLPAAAPVPLEPFVHDPDLEEAAILFANADYAGAEACLVDVLAQNPTEVTAALQEIWMTLFDLYRATGNQEAFDKLSIDFAAQFSRSAPLWFSMPEQLGLASEAENSAAALVRRDFNWNAPSSMTLQSVAALQASLGRSRPPWTMVWTRLASVEESALPVLTQEFNRWGDQKAQLTFVGAERLQALLLAHTQSGDRSSNPEWWRLRMAALRLMAQPEEFELVALDYCVTYEVSPPSWVDPRCTYIDAAQGDSASHALLSASDSAERAQSIAPAGLSGHIQSDATEALQTLEISAHPGEPLVVPCDRLIRVDFSAAGSILNWAAGQQAQKREVHFKNLHRLVAVLFNVVGINEHAWIIPRKN